MTLIRQLLKMKKALQKTCRTTPLLTLGQYLYETWT